MFTGIVEEIGRIVGASDRGGDLRLRVEARTVLSDLSVGHSIALSGCCLTAVSVDGGGFEVELSKETVAMTAPRWHAGARVNLERALRADGRFGGHIVSGHVEGVGQVLAVRSEPGAYLVTVRAPAGMAPYFVPKGSITVDGVSLTLLDVGGPGGTRPDLAASDFSLGLIPHTLAVTTLAELAAGSLVNLESDTLARYAERLAYFRASPVPGSDAPAAAAPDAAAGPAAKEWS